MSGDTKSRNWRDTPAIAKWIAGRKTEGAALRRAVWNELAPLRAALASSPPAGDGKGGVDGV